MTKRIQLVDITQNTKIIINSIQCIAFSNDSQYAIISGNDGSLTVWSMNNIKNYKRVQAHQHFIPYVKVCKLRPEFVSCSFDFTLKRWSLPGGELLGTAHGHTNYVYVHDFSHDERTLISGSFDKTIRVWDMERLTERYCLTNPGDTPETDADRVFHFGHEGVLHAVSVVNDRKLVAFITGDAQVRLWDYKKGMLINDLVGHHHKVECVSTTSDGRLAVSVGDDHNSIVWDLKQHTQKHILKGPKSRSWIVLVSHDNRMAISAHAEHQNDYEIWCWDLRTGKSIRKITGHTGTIKSLALSPDDRWLVSCGNDATMRLWDMSSGECVQVCPERPRKKGINVCAWSPDGRIVISGDDAGRIQFYAVEEL